MRRLFFAFVFPIAIAMQAAEIRFEHSPDLQKLVDRAVENAALSFGERKLRVEQIAVTLVDLKSASRGSNAGTRIARPSEEDGPSEAVRLRVASHRESERIYPASVVKLFYLEAAHRWMEDGRIADTPELHRTMKDMIVESYNDATSYVVDVLTGTTSGPELPAEEMAEKGRRGQTRVLPSRRCSAKHWRLPRKIRVEYPGAIYHVMSRGDRREDIFHDDVLKGSN